jgi:hypothetical protein
MKIHTNTSIIIFIEKKKGVAYARANRSAAWVDTVMGGEGGAGPGLGGDAVLSDVDHRNHHDGVWQAGASMYPER